MRNIFRITCSLLSMMSLIADIMRVETRKKKAEKKKKVEEEEKKKDEGKKDEEKKESEVSDIFN